MEKMEKLEKALKSNQLLEYLIGLGEYNYVNRYEVTPTDPYTAFGRIRLYCEKKNQSILQPFLEALLELSSNKEYCWTSLYYVHAYLNLIKGDNSHEYPVLNIQNIMNNIKLHKAYLSNNKDWLGYRYEDGLWGDVKKSVEFINQKFELEIEI